jgi:radical SAM superfamily enzyme YgiQ (UPF0313 family)
MIRRLRKKRREVVFFYPSTGLDVPHVSVFLPLSVMIPAAALESEGYVVKIVDQRIDGNWRRSLADEARGRPVYVGVSAMTGTQIHWALKGAEIIRKVASDVPIVWGGIHPSILPEQTLSDGRVDAVVAGRGEKAAVDLADAYVHGVGRHRKLEAILRNSASGEHFGTGFHQPPIAYPRVPWHEYVTPVVEDSEGLAHVTSRGCPHRCGYCYNSNVNDSRWQGESSRAVIETLRRIRMLGCRGVIFFDDNFFADRRRVEEIALGLAEEKPGLKIKADCRADYILRFDDAFLRLLKRAGFEMLYIGAESGSDRVLDMVDKNVTVKEVIDANRRLAKAEIRPHYSFMAGLPGETESDLYATIRLMRRLKGDHPGACLSPVKGYIPYPGTKIFEKAVAGGFEPPLALEEWSALDWNSASRPWLTKRQARLVEKASYVTFALDDHLLSGFGMASYPLLARALGLYADICRRRCQKDGLGFTPELPVLRALKRLVNCTGWPQRILRRYD